jgi:hypothetical protein
MHLVDSFYQWKKLGPEEKQPYAIALADRSLTEPMRRVSLQSSVVLHEQNANWIVPYFSSLAIIRPGDAQIKAEALAEMLGGRCDRSGHPLSGVRAVHDDMLNIIQALYRPNGEEPSRWGQASPSGSSR